MFERNLNSCADEAICRRGVNSLKDALMILTDERVMYDRRKRDEDARRQASLYKQDSDVAKKVIHTGFEELEVPPRRFPPDFPAHET
jgi:transcription initiation factor IIE alpha subunit